MSKVEEFRSYRKKMNERILAGDNKIIKRIYSLDSMSYQEGRGNLDVRVKEIIGLTTSLVLRCDDCVKYHIEKCVELGWSNEEIEEAMSVATLIGGTIVIPHLRRAIEYMDELRVYNEKNPESKI
ncbi:MAG: carboxymuconolactone decarboxylase family protein [Flammeovirgaceae bacterium]